MKTTRLFSFLILISLVSNANAQLRVLSNGRVQAGLLKDNNEDLGNVTSMQIYGRIGDARAGSKLTFGDFGQYANQGWNVFAGEYGTTDTDQLWLHGKLGIYMTTNGYANNVVAYYNPASNTNFVFNYESSCEWSEYNFRRSLEGKCRVAAKSISSFRASEWGLLFIQPLYT